MRSTIIWMGVIVALGSLTASHAQDARESDPVAVTRSFLGAWAASSGDDLMKFMADDAVVVGSTGAKFTGEAGLRRVIGNLKGLENREYDTRLEGGKVTARGKTYGWNALRRPGRGARRMGWLGGGQGRTHRVLRVALRAGI